MQRYTFMLAPYFFFGPTMALHILILESPLRTLKLCHGRRFA